MKVKLIIRISTALFCLLLLTNSCVKEIEYKGDEGDPVLVLNQIIEKDSTFKVQIEKSVFFLDANNGDNSLSNAQLTLLDKTSGVSEVLLSGVNGTYTFGMVAQEGHSYEINGAHPDFTSVKATTFIPSVVPLTSVDTVTLIQNNGFTPQLEATLTWNDPVGKNYYMVLCKYSDSFGNWSLFMSSTDISIQGAGSDIGGNDKSGEFFALDDATFDGNQKSLKIRYFVPMNSPAFQTEYILINCTEDAYKYLISAYKNLEVGGDPFTEPVKVFDNIENGLGIFAGLSKSKIIL